MIYLSPHVGKLPNIYHSSRVTLGTPPRSLGGILTTSNSGSYLTNYNLITCCLGRWISQVSMGRVSRPGTRYYETRTSTKNIARLRAPGFSFPRQLVVPDEWRCPYQSHGMDTARRQVKHVLARPDLHIDLLPGARWAGFPAATQGRRAQAPVLRRVEMR